MAAKDQQLTIEDHDNIANHVWRDGDLVCASTTLKELILKQSLSPSLDTTFLHIAKENGGEVDGATCYC